MLVDELVIHAKAGNGGDGVVRWRREKFKPMGGPSGGNGANGGDVYLRGVRNINQLAKYTGEKVFRASNGGDGAKNSRHGKRGTDLYIDVPVGSQITNLTTGRVHIIEHEGEEVKVLSGGRGGLGNEYFKSATNRSPQEATNGTKGESAELKIEVILTADVGLVGLPNAGKSTLLNTLTNARSEVGAYPFTTLEPHLGALGPYLVADIPGLIEGAHEGKGLGHRFLKHISRTKMLLHLVSLDSENPKNDYQTIVNELTKYNIDVAQKEQWIIFTKKDEVTQEYIDKVLQTVDTDKNRVFVISILDEKSIQELADELVSHLKAS